MQRLASTIGLGAWLGHSAGQVFLLGAHALGFDANAAASAATGIDLALPPLTLDAAEAGLGASLLASVSLALGAALVRLHHPASCVQADGERLAGAALAGLAALAGSAALVGSELAGAIGAGAGFTLALAATFGALLFDHMMDEGARPEDEETFEAIMAAIRAAPRAGQPENRPGRDGEGDAER